MNKYSYNIATLVAAISLLVVAGCGGGGGGGGSFDSPDADGGTPGGTTGLGLITSTAEANPLTGPQRYLTGYTAVGGVEEFIGQGFGAPPFTLNIDTNTNTISDDFSGAFIPEIVYDDDGRGIQLDLIFNPIAPIVNIEYNDDNTIAGTNQTTREGLVVIETTFIYEDGRLVGKASESVLSNDFNSTITYIYTDEGVLDSAIEEFSQSGDLNRTGTRNFLIDDFGRVIGSAEFNADSVGTSSSTIVRFDANGNIESFNRQEDNIIDTELDANYNYTASAEPTVNVYGLLAALNDGFIPFFDDLSGLLSSDSIEQANQP